MRPLSIIAALALGLAIQAMAGSGAHSTPKLKPGVVPKLAHQYAPKYDIVTVKVVQGVKFHNPAAAKGFDPQPGPPGGAMLALPRAALSNTPLHGVTVANAAVTA